MLVKPASSPAMTSDNKPSDQQKSLGNRYLRQTRQASFDAPEFRQNRPGRCLSEQQRKFLPIPATGDAVNRSRSVNDRGYR
ncbi:MAG: hypothetical protein R3C49_08785 [Planctomycetaceae bacterium]